MKVLRTLEDRDQLTDSVVIIDVFRSSNTIIEILYKGAEAVIAVEKEKKARELKKDHPDWLLFGERDGIMIDGFDGDNSPTSFGHEVAGKRVILTTSGGTRCISACKRNSTVRIGSFSNANALINRLQSHSSDVAFWAVGRKGELRVPEDDMCADYLADLFKGITGDFKKIKDELVVSESADRLRVRNLEQDLEYCLLLNNRDVVPVCQFTEDDTIEIKLEK